MLLRLRAASILCAIAAFAPCAPAGAYVATVAPVSGAPTTVVKLNGSGFAASSLVDIYWDTTQISFGSTTATGALTPSSINVPASASVGTHYITVKNDGTAGGAQAAFLVRTNWLTYRGSPAHRNYNATENTLTTATVGNLEWHWTATMAAGHAMQSPPLVVSGFLYTRDNQGDLTKWSLATHAKIWRVSTGLGNSGDTGITSSGGNIFISGPGALRAYKASNGALVWQASVGGANEGTTTPTVAAGVVYVFAEGNSNPGLYAYSATCGTARATCQPLWLGSGGSSTSQWGPLGAVTVVNGVIVANSVNGPIAWATDCVPTAGVCAPLWSTGTNFSFGTPSYAAGYVWISDGENHIAALHLLCNTAPCTAAKTLNSGAPIAYDVAIAGTSVYNSTNAGLQVFSTACEASPCSALQSYAIPGATGATVAGGLVFVTANEILAFDRQCLSCGPIWSAAATGSFNTSPVVADGVLYIPDENNGVLVYDLNAAAQQIVANRAPPTLASLHRDPEFNEAETAAWLRVQAGEPINELQPKVTPAAGDED